MTTFQSLLRSSSSTNLVVSADAAYVQAAGDEAIDGLMDRVGRGVSAFVAAGGSHFAAKASTVAAIMGGDEPSGAREPGSQPSASTYGITEKSTTTELLQLLNRKGVDVRMQVLREILSRCSNNTGAINPNDVVQLLQGTLRPCLNALMNKENPSEHEVALRVLLLEAKRDSSSIRQAGGIPTLVSFLSSASPAGKVMDLVVLQTLASQRKNKDFIMRSGFVESAMPLLGPGFPLPVQISAMRALCSLTAEHNKSQELVCKLSGWELMMKIIGDPTTQSKLLIPALLLCEKLSECATVKSTVSKVNISTLMSKLDVSLVYTQTFQGVYKGEAKTPEREISIQIHTAVMSILTELAFLELPREVISSTGGIELALSFLRPPPDIPFDVLEWDMDIEASVLGLLNNLMLSSQNRQKFVQLDGLKPIESILALTDIFPESVVLTCASVVSKLFDDLAHGANMETIVKLHRLLPNNEKLQKVLISSMQSLCTSEQGRGQIFQAGGVQILIEKLSQNLNADITSNIVKILMPLSVDKFFRKVLRAIESAFTSIIIHLSTTTDEALQLLLLELINQLACEDLDSKVALSKVNIGETQAAVFFHLARLSANGSDAVKLKAMDAFLQVYHPSTINMFIASGALKTVIQLLVCKNQNIQKKAITFMSALFTNIELHPLLVQADIVTTLKNLRFHENVVKPTSELVEPLSQLIASWKELADLVELSKANPVPVEMIVLILGNIEQPLRVNPSTLSLETFRAGVAKILEIPEETMELKCQRGEKMWDILTTPQLRLHLSGKTASEQPIVHVIKKGDVAQAISVPEPPPPPPVDPAEEEAARTLSRMENPVLVHLVKLLAKEANLSLQKTLELLSKNPYIPPPAPKPTAASQDREEGSSSYSPMMPLGDLSSELMKEIKSAVKGKIRMRHVDLEAEQVRRRADRQKYLQRGLLDDFMEAIKTRNKGNRRVLSIDIWRPRELWRKPSTMDRWIDDVRGCVGGVVGGLMAKVLLHLCIMEDSKCTFPSVLEMLQPATVQCKVVADLLCNVGFGVQYQSVQVCPEDEDAYVVEEPLSVLRPHVLPIPQLLRALELAVKLASSSCWGRRGHVPAGRYVHGTQFCGPLVDPLRSRIPIAGLLSPLVVVWQMKRSSFVGLVLVFLPCFVGHCRGGLSTCSGVPGAIVYDNGGYPSSTAAVVVWPCESDPKNKKCGTLVQEVRVPTVPFRITTVCGLFVGEGTSALALLTPVMYYDAAFSVVPYTKVAGPVMLYTLPGGGEAPQWVSVDVSPYNFTAFSEVVYVGFSVEWNASSTPVALLADNQGTFHSCWFSANGNNFSLLQTSGWEPTDYYSALLRVVGNATDLAAVGGAPPFWKCDSAKWNDGTCDCGCGCYDIDCENHTNPSSCATDQLCHPTLLSCESPWFNCSASEWWDGSTCDCDCGSGVAADPDCLDRRWQFGGWNTPALNVSGCRNFSNAYCDSFNLTCGIYNYECGFSTYSASDGCNCECGSAEDPDCKIAGEPTLNCPSNSTCVAGKCEDESSSFSFSSSSLSLSSSSESTFSSSHSSSASLRISSSFSDSQSDSSSFSDSQSDYSSFSHSSRFSSLSDSQSVSSSHGDLPSRSVSFSDPYSTLTSFSHSLSYSTSHSHSRSVSTSSSSHSTSASTSSNDSPPWSSSERITGPSDSSSEEKKNQDGLKWGLVGGFSFLAIAAIVGGCIAAISLWRRSKQQQQQEGEGEEEHTPKVELECASSAAMPRLSKLCYTDPSLDLGARE
ncbi:class VII unconventional myosin [Pelomyxa schiedti]|nr:class VII unconventional myosin [Pelomyxa schiedti]